MCYNLLYIIVIEKEKLILIKLFSFAKKSKTKIDPYSKWLDQIDENDTTKLEEIRNAMEILDVEYGIAPKKYISNKYYKLPTKKQIRKANQKRLLDIRIEKAALETSLSKKEIKALYTQSHKDCGITQKDYFDNKLYLEESDRKRYERKKRKAEIEQKKIVKDLAAITGWKKKHVLRELEKANRLFGITGKEYASARMYTMSETQMARKHISLIKKANNKQQLFDAIFTATGKDKKTVNSEIKILRTLAVNQKVSLNWYYMYGYHYCDFEDKDTIQERINLNYALEKDAKRIRKIIAEIDEKSKTYKDLEQEMESYLARMNQLLSKEKKHEFVEKAKYAIPEITEDSLLGDKIATDIEATWQIFRYLPTEYIMFEFWNKSYEERRKFISSQLKKTAIRMMNTEEVVDLFDNKYASYDKLRDYYGRDAIILRKKSQYNEFAEFCKKHQEFAIKSNYGAMGKGVAKGSIKSLRPLKSTFESFIDSEDMVIMEELIKPHKSIYKLNPDSVNTVRIVVYVDNGVPKVQDCFMKVGRKDSFVDNGGSGGIFVHINKENGSFDSGGIDEKGIRYAKHPDHNYKFMGYKLPLWKEALRIAKEASCKIDSTCYIGWDLTLTSEKKWIIVEGNSRTQFYGQQATKNKGQKDELLSIIQNEKEKLLNK